MIVKTENIANYSFAFAALHRESQREEPLQAVRPGQHGWALHLQALQHRSGAVNLQLQRM